jgi:transcriptional regulator with XRE-family HTH domain
MGGIMETKRMIGLRIRELRKKAGLSQEAVAERAGITSKHLSSIELGKENPTIDTYSKLASVFDIEIRDLFDFGHQIKGKEIQKVLSRVLKNASETELRLFLKFINTIRR